MRPLFAHLSAQQAHTYNLILSASNIPHQLQLKNSGWWIDVDSVHRPLAIQAVGLYLKENQPEARDTAPPSKHPTRRAWSAVFVALLLLVLHWAIRSGYERQVFIKTYGADAQSILAGQLYRCVTAMLLHVDWPHVISNAVAMALFGTVVISSCGWGLGWLLILVAGGCGNLLTALWYQKAHLSVGASTAVFAAVGLCAVLAMGRKTAHLKSSWRAWAPLAGGLALLAFMGAAPSSDLLAHFFGFAVGVALGGVYVWKVRQVLGWPLQLSAAIVTLTLIISSWIRGMLL